MCVVRQKRNTLSDRESRLNERGVEKGDGYGR